MNNHEVRTRALSAFINLHNGAALIRMDLRPHHTEIHSSSVALNFLNVVTHE